LPETNPATPARLAQSRLASPGLAPSQPSTADLRARDAASFWHPFTDHAALAAEGTRIITRAEGVWLTDSDGKTYLDGMSGLWCTQIGHGRAEIADAVHAQMTELAYYNAFFKSATVPAILLAEKVAALAPAGMGVGRGAGVGGAKVFFTSSGSEANDTVIRLVRHYWALMGRPEKSVLVARRNGYHGSTVGAASLGGMAPMHAQGGLPIPGIVHIAQPYWFDDGGDLDPDSFGLQAARALEEAIDRLGPDRVGAFVAEPIQGAGGVVIPPATYWPEIARICRARDILLVVDEVICGFGRTGRWFGADYFGVTPDLMPIAKGLTSGYLPMGGVVVGARVADVVTTAGDDFHHGFTASGHPAAAAAALANLAILEREHLVERVADDIGPYLQTRWAALADHPLVGEARMVGLIGALELVPAKPARRRFPDVGKVGTLARDHALKNGLVMRAVRDSLIIAPPFVLSHAEADDLIARAARTLDDTHADIRRLDLAG
jgi:putrescine aminotransferase